MIFVADEGVEWQIVDALRKAGHEVWYVADQMPSASDDFILSTAAQLEAILVTADKDFGDLVFRLKRASGGVVLLRLSGTPSSVKVARVVRAVDAYGPQMARAFTVVTPRSVRIRRLDNF